jgi:hypothetical protein
MVGQNTGEAVVPLREHTFVGELAQDRRVERGIPAGVSALKEELNKYDPAE